MSGLKMNFHKSDVYCETRQNFEEIFTCKVGSLPMKYQGVPVDEKRLKNSDWNPCGEKLEKKFNCWYGNNLSIRGRILLIITSLSVSYCICSPCGEQKEV
jgi:hypothetical protein